MSEFTDPEHRSKLALECQSLAGALGCLDQVPLLEREITDVCDHGCELSTLVELAEGCSALLEAAQRDVIVAGSRRCDPQVAEQDRYSVTVTELPVERKTLLRHFLSPAQVVVCGGEDARSLEDAGTKLRRLWVRGQSRALEPAAALHDVAVLVQEGLHRSGQTERQLDLPGLVRPGQSRPKVVVLALESTQPVCLLRAEQFVSRTLRECNEPFGMPPKGAFGIVAHAQVLEREGADRVQHPVTLVQVAEEALLDERLQGVEV